MIPLPFLNLPTRPFGTAIIVNFGKN